MDIRDLKEEILNRELISDILAELDVIISETRVIMYKQVIVMEITRAVL